MLKKWVLLVVLGVAALATGDVVTTGGGGGGGGGSLAPVEGNGLQVIPMSGALLPDGFGGGSVSVAFIFVRVPTGTTHVTVCETGGGFCASNWIALDDWQSATVTFTCADLGYQLIYACSNNASSGAADYCGLIFVDVQDANTVCVA